MGERHRKYLQSILNDSGETSPGQIDMSLWGESWIGSSWKHLNVRCEWNL